MSRSSSLTLSEICRVAHDTVRALQIVQCDPEPDLSWDRAPQWSRDDTRDTVSMLLAGVSPARLHEEWRRERLADGWTYGETLDAMAKTDPRVVPYEQLTPQLVAQDAVRAAVAGSLAPYLR